MQCAFNPDPMHFSVDPLVPCIHTHACTHTEGFPNDVIASLESKGHRVTKSSNHAVVQGIHVNEEGVVSAHSDSRKQGQAVVLNI